MIVKCHKCNINIERKNKRKFYTCKKCAIKIAEINRQGTRKEYLREYKQINKEKLRQNVKKAHLKYDKTKKGLLAKKVASAKYRATKRKATPKWAKLKEIKEFYKNCPKGYEVDHIYPLQADWVCGLHVLANLQYLSAKANKKKGNRKGAIHG